MPQNDDNDPETGTDDAKVDRILSGMKGARMPDILKVQSSESKGEKFASYQGSHALRPGEDTQKDMPAVLVDQTQQDGIAASEIASLKAERRERNRREATTAVIELDQIPKTKKSNGALLVFLAVLGAAAIGLFIQSQRTPPEDGLIAPATAASVVETAEPTIPAPPPPDTAPVATSAAAPTIEPNSAQISTTTTAVMTAAPVRSSPSSPSSSHASPAASGSADPDLLLFKPHRTP